MSPRLRRIAGLALVAALGLVLLASGSTSERVTCDRARGICSVTAGLPLVEETADIPLAEISDCRFAATSGRGGPRGATVLIDRVGRERAIARGSEEVARARYESLRAFFAGEVDAVEVTSGPTWWLVALGVLVLAGGPWLLRDDSASGPPSGRGSLASEPAARTSPWILALVVTALVLAGLVANYVLGRDRGTLDLRCHQRCDIDGGTCMPGAELTLTLAPGEHEVRIYDPDAPDAPIVRRVAIVRGETTRFECALPRDAISNVVSGPPL